MNIELTQREFDYLTKEDFVPKQYQDVLIKSAKNINGSFSININDDDADEIREACLEQLPLVGFDINYEPNEYGIMLENLIDKFFTG